MQPQQTLDIDRLTDKEIKSMKKKISLLEKLIDEHDCKMGWQSSCSCINLYIEMAELKSELRSRG